MALAAMLMPAVLTAAFLSACTSSGATAKTVDIANLHAAAISRVKDVVQTTGITLRSAKLLINSCNDESQGNSFRAEIIGYYAVPTTPAASRAAVSGWVTKLRTHGWSTEGVITRNGTALRGAEASESLELHELVAGAIKPIPPNVSYFGPCHPLPDNERGTPGPTDKIDNVLHELQP